MGEGSIETIWIQVLDTWKSSLGSFTLPSIEPSGNMAGDVIDHSVTVHKHISPDFNANISDRSENKIKFVKNEALRDWKNVQIYTDFTR